MLAQIDDFMFEVNKTSFDNLKRSISYKFSLNERIKNFNTFQNIGKYEEKIELEGVLLLKSQEQLKKFETMAKEKKARTLAFGDGTCKTIIILSLDLNQSQFLNNGSFLRQSFKIDLAVDEDGYSYDK